LISRLTASATIPWYKPPFICLNSSKRVDGGKDTVGAGSKETGKLMQGTGSLLNDNPNRENKAEFVVIDARSRHLFKDEQGLKGSELQPLVHIETP